MQTNWLDGWVCCLRMGNGTKILQEKWISWTTVGGGEGWGPPGTPSLAWPPLPGPHRLPLPRQPHIPPSTPWVYNLYLPSSLMSLLPSGPCNMGETRMSSEANNLFLFLLFASGDDFGWQQLDSTHLWAPIQRWRWPTFYLHPTG